MLKKILFSITLFLVSTYVEAQTVTIDESGGWLETAYVKWQPVAGAESYNVYYSGEGITNQKIDNPLIRSYGSYFRADILGLKAGSYTISVASVILGIEDLLPQDRLLYYLMIGMVLPLLMDEFLVLIILMELLNQVPLFYTSPKTPKTPFRLM